MGERPQAPQSVATPAQPPMFLPRQSVQIGALTDK